MTNRSGSVFLFLTLWTAALAAMGCSQGGGPDGADDRTDSASSSNADLYSIGVLVTGLSGTLVLQNDQAYDLVVDADGPQTFSTKLADRSYYAVAVKEQPDSQICTVDDGLAFGTVNGADVTGIPVDCVNARYVGGNVFGMEPGNSIVIGLGNLTGWQTTATVDANGNYQFEHPVTVGDPYGVYVDTQPTGQTCYVQNATGVIDSSDILDAHVFCWSAVDAYTADGVVEISDITANSNGDLYAVGYAEILVDSEANRHWIVRKSTDGGDSWAVVDDYYAPVKEDVLDSVYDDHFQAAAVVADGANVYVAGHTVYNSETSGSSVQQLVIRKSDDHGASWAELASPLLNTVPTDLSYNAALDTLIVSANTGSMPSSWIAGAIDPVSGGFVTIHTIADNSIAHAVASDSSGAVYTAGWVQPTLGPESDQRHWYVTKSTYSGGWSTSVAQDTYMLDWDLAATDIVVYADDEIFVSGVRHDLFSSWGYEMADWTVEHSDNGGNSWNSLDTYLMGQPEPSPTYEIYLAAHPTSGALFATGLARRDHEYAGADYQLARSSADGLTWGTIDNTGKTNATGNLPRGICVDPSGAIFVAGISTENGVWFVKRYRP